MVGAGSPKVQLLLELKNTMKSGLAKAKKMVQDDVNSMKAKLAEMKKTASDTFEGLAGRLNLPGGIGGGIFTAGKAGIIAAGIGLITAAGIEATKTAMQWEASMAKVNVTAQLQKKDLTALSEQIKDIAERNTTPFEDVPEAFNKIVSAGMSTNDALKMLEPTLQAAKAGFTDVETTARAAVNVMASSGVNDAVRVYDILFATLNKGNAEFADIANYLPKIIPMSRTVGISLEDAAGAFAYLTAQGYKAEAATTGLMNVFKAFSDVRTIKGFKSIGVEIFNKKGEMRGLLPVIQDLKKGMEGLTDRQRTVKLDKIGLDTEASATLASMVQDYEKLSGIIDFTNNSQGQLNASIENAKTSMDEWKKLANELKRAYVDIGEVLSPVANYLTDVIKATKWFASSSMDMWTNNWRFLKTGGGMWGDFTTVQEDRRTKKEQEQRNEWLSQFSQYNDKQIKDYVQKQGVQQFVKNSSQNVRDLADNSLVAIKWLNEDKKVISDALDSKDKKVKGILKKYGISSTDDFYNVMNQGKADEAANKLRPLLSKSTLQPNPGASKYDNLGTGNSSSSSVNGQSGRNITINIDSFIKGDVISQNQSIQGMNKEELVRFLQEAFRRMIADAEMIPAQ